jgi:hypothetical protein
MFPWNSTARMEHTRNTECEQWRNSKEQGQRRPEAAQWGQMKTRAQRQGGALVNDSVAFYFFPLCVLACAAGSACVAFPLAGGFSATVKQRGDKGAGEESRPCVQKGGGMRVRVAAPLAVWLCLPRASSCLPVVDQSQWDCD